MRVSIDITNLDVTDFARASGITDLVAIRTGLEAVAVAIGRQAIQSALNQRAEVTVGQPEGPWAPGRRKFRDRPERHRYDDGEAGSRAWNRDLILWQQEENTTPARPVEDRPDPSGLDEFHETWEDPNA